MDVKEDTNPFQILPHMTHISVQNTKLKSGVNINGKHSTHLRFADDIVHAASNTSEANNTMWKLTGRKTEVTLNISSSINKFVLFIIPRLLLSHIRLKAANQ